MAIEYHYVGVNLRPEFMELIDKEIEKRNGFFKSRAEFVRYCVRKELEEWLQMRS